ncbi:MAG TPA: HAMP domain-containing sensor histidine kinase [Lachnospiraceae bacterium]|nr:HAMP domain-containing sensor histidine kinase [Lachnospiraceae bacterium]
MKTRDICKLFIRRALPDAIFYSLAILFISTFYSLSTSDKVEILYPYGIATFIFVVWMLVRFIPYFQFYRRLNRMTYNNDYNGRFAQKDFALINEHFNIVHRYYLETISREGMDRESNRRFLSTWIHDMKTPISVINLITQRLERGEIEVTSAIEDMKRENDRLLHSLDMVLNMIRLEEFAGDYSPEEFDLIKELNDIINRNRSLFIYARVFPKVITDCDSARILSDRKWNRHMIDQLISNAVKYSKENECSKNVTFHIKKEDSKVILSIVDEGIGIDEHDLKRVFEPFFTGENGREGHSSSGIGLYFCREVSRMLGCNIEITSRKGEGTTVLVSYQAY